MGGDSVVKVLKEHLGQVTFLRLANCEGRPLGPLYYPTPGAAGGHIYVMYNENSDNGVLKYCSEDEKIGFYDMASFTISQQLLPRLV